MVFLTFSNVSHVFPTLSAATFDTPRHSSVEVPDPLIGPAADAVEDHGGGQETERRQIPADVLDPTR